VAVKSHGSAVMKLECQLQKKKTLHYAKQSII